MNGLDFTKLPEDCLAGILSLTTPADACRFSVASSTVRSVADSDAVWEKLLPSGYTSVVARSTSPLKFSSKKELFFLLCKGILIDGGAKRFTLERFSGKKSYVISSRELDIAWGNEPMHWIWTFTPRSRFLEVAELKTVSQLEIQAKIRTRMLSPNTTYGAFLIFKTTESAFGLHSIPSETSVEVGRNVSTGTAYLCPRDSKKQLLESLVYLNRKEMLNRGLNQGEGTRVPIEREDGWMEIELGKFFNDEGDEDVKISVGEVKSNHFKGGLVVEGIDVRPS